MDKTVSYRLNNLPKKLKIILLSVPVLSVILIGRVFSDDFYFIYKTGEYICNNGFPINDMLSMHSDMKIVVQQWLCDVLFYKLYNIFGENSIFMYVYIGYLLFVFLFYKTAKLVSNNSGVSILVTIVICVSTCSVYFSSRPQVITFSIILLLLYCLESYIKTKNMYWLFALPMLSIFLINWHASMWWLLFIFMLPYVVNAIPVNIKKVKQEPCCNIFALLATMAVMFGVGFINPYGWDAINYIFGSYGVDEINDLIGEMNAVLLGDVSNIMFVILLVFYIVVFSFYKKDNLKSRFFFLTLGTLVLGLSSYKGLMFFYICSGISVAHYIRDYDHTFEFKAGTRTKKEKLVLATLIVLFCLLLVSLLALTFSTNKQDTNKSRFEYLDEVIVVLDDKPKEDVVLFNEFNDGQYLEYNGYKAYIDCRIELFIKKNNKSFDYLDEYYKVINGKVYYKDFIDKYGFNCLVVDNADYIMYNSLVNDSNFEITYKNTKYTLFELKE